MINRRHFGIAAGMAAAVALTAGALIASTASASPASDVGTAAPAFTGVTASGETVSLSDYAGQTVVLEWTNHDCPFVMKHYAEPHLNMQTLQGDAATSDTVWLQVISSAPGKQGHVSAEEATALNVQRGAAPAGVILDPTGEIGRAYNAKTTPHMYVIDGAGLLQYAGAIDSVRSSKPADIPDAENYVMAALDSVAAGEPVATATSKAYGCSVKY